MLIDVSSLTAMGSACYPAVHPRTMLAIVQVESGRDPLAIGVNGPRRTTLHPRGRHEAAQIARRLLAAGTDFDVGLAQINVRNLRPLGLSIADAFDPCRNLAGGARILAQAYLAQAPDPGRTSPALRAALSAYNTGDPERGVRNGYVARVWRASAQIVPANDPTDAGATSAPALAPPIKLRHATPAASQPAPASPVASTLDVFVQTNRTVLVWPDPARPPQTDVSASETHPPPSNGDPP